MTLRVDDSGFRRKMSRIQAELVPARQRAARGAVAYVARYIERNAPRDTNRYVAAYMQAANQAGVGSFAVPPIVRSRRARQNLERLQRQSDRLIRTLRAWYGDEDSPTKREPDKWFWRLRRALDKAIEQIEKFQTSGGTAVVIGGKASARSIGARLATVREKVYGGRGRTIDLPDRTIIVLHNLEAHASIVEKRDRLMAGARLTLRAMGIRPIGIKWAKELAARAAA